ncbi:MAG: hypothetical protein RR022_03790 [Angelakisella sp.]
MPQWEKAQLTQLMLPQTIAGMLQSGRMTHAVCIEGAPGTGRLQLAYSIAGAVLCERQQGRMCGECLPCRKVLAGVHMDITLADPAAGGYKKDAVRTLRSEIYRAPHEGRSKVLLLPDAELMSPEVQNLLLKVIEEPPDDTYFILICENRYRLLGTVLSRVVTVSTGGSEDGVLLERLLADETGQAAKTLVAAMAQGREYPVLTALVPTEKNRQSYAKALETAHQLLGLAPLCAELRLSPQKVIILRRALSQAAARNELNGYLPVISAALAYQITLK